MGLVREALQRLATADSEALGLASAAPGADILFHEACAALSLRSLLCLPMPADTYARLAFGDADDWRARFLAVFDRHRARRGELLELSDREGLPRWLDGTSANPWERGNRWVLQMALAAGARRITLLALWDGEAEGDGPGGTAHMVQLVRDTGGIDIRIIDAGELSRSRPV